MKRTTFAIILLLLSVITTNAQIQVDLSGDTSLCVGESSTIAATITSQKDLAAVTWIDGGTPSNVSFNGSTPTYSIALPVEPTITTTDNTIVTKKIIKQ